MSRRASVAIVVAAALLAMPLGSTFGVLGRPAGAVLAGSAHGWSATRDPRPDAGDGYRAVRAHGVAQPAVHPRRSPDPRPIGTANPFGAVSPLLILGAILALRARIRRPPACIAVAPSRAPPSPLLA